ncbi:hypothetical protein EBL89_07280 [Cereibacter sphaeroides]|nr:hypothetical protein EBL89_07280 [Cereibacter sphaeroides]AZB59378.1 hypothetical protein EBL88_07210 [Cereibacter sphaeroides]
MSAALFLRAPLPARAHPARTSSPGLGGRSAPAPLATSAGVQCFPARGRAVPTDAALPSRPGSAEGRA